VSFDAHVRAAVDRVLSEVRVPASAALHELAATVATEARASARRLSDAMRAIDEAASLGDVLQALTQGVSHEVDRAALLVATSGRLRGRQCAGFIASVHPSSIDLPIDDTGLIGTAVRTKAMAVSLASSSGTPVSAAPSFAGMVGPRDAAAIPIVLGGTVAAVLYCDGPPADDSQPAWLAPVGLLVRHAGLVLEAKTTRYLTGATG